MVAAALLRVLEAGYQETVAGYQAQEAVSREVLENPGPGSDPGQAVEGMDSLQEAEQEWGPHPERWKSQAPQEEQKAGHSGLELGEKTLVGSWSGTGRAGRVGHGLEYDMQGGIWAFFWVTEIDCLLHK